MRKVPKPTDCGTLKPDLLWSVQMFVLTNRYSQTDLILQNHSHLLLLSHPPPRMGLRTLMSKSLGSHLLTNQNLILLLLLLQLPFHPPYHHPHHLLLLLCHLPILLMTNLVPQLLKLLEFCPLHLCGNPNETRNRSRSTLLAQLSQKVSNQKETIPTRLTFKLLRHMPQRFYLVNRGGIRMPSLVLIQISG